MCIFQVIFLRANYFKSKLKNRPVVFIFPKTCKFCEQINFLEYGKKYNLLQMFHTLCNILFIKETHESVKKKSSANLKQTERMIEPKSNKE
jgi:hypothetical protein